MNWNPMSEAECEPPDELGALRAENARLRELLQQFIDFQISDYDRVANRAKDYCRIRRDARIALASSDP